VPRGRQIADVGSGHARSIRSYVSRTSRIQDPHLLTLPAQHVDPTGAARRERRETSGHT